MSNAKLDRIIEKKLETMKKQLLDTGKRNRMINYRETKRATMKIVTPEYRELFNRLVLKEETLKFQYPIDRDHDLRAYSFLTLMKTLGHEIPVRIGDIETGASSPGEQKLTLRNLRSKARLAQEEQGTNILYLSFGFVKWREKNTPTSPFIAAPLIMVPVSLTIKSLNAPYELSRYDDDIVVNPTIAYKFEHEYNLTLPEFEAIDEKSLDKFFAKIEKIVDERGWQISRDVSLGLVSFLKISMYHDLEKKHNLLIHNPNIRAICGDVDAIQLPEAAKSLYDLDQLVPSEQFQVIDADSSQGKAIALSKMGASFVLQGPPGTGKSQTITNMIAEALAAGKKVLFVSEKAAALEVVLRRLTEAHISDFCLSLHDYKANKRDVLSQLEKCLQMNKFMVKQTAINDLVRLAKVREELNQYAQELHEIISPLNVSLYQVFGEIAQFTDPVDFVCTIEDVENVSETDFQILNYSVEKYVQAFEEMSCKYQNNPWRGTSVISTSTMYLTELKSRTQLLPEALRKLTILMQEPIGPDHFENVTLQDVQAQIEKLSNVKNVPIHDPALHSIPFPAIKKMLITAKTARLEKQFLQSTQYEFNRQFDESIIDQPINEWLQRIKKDTYAIQQYTGWESQADEAVLSDLEDIIEQTKTAEIQCGDVYGDLKKIRSIANLPCSEQDVRLSEINMMVSVATSLTRVSSPFRISWLSMQEAQKTKKLILDFLKIIRQHKQWGQKLESVWKPTLNEYSSGGIHQLFQDSVPFIQKHYSGHNGQDYLAGELESIQEMASSAIGMINEYSATAREIMTLLGCSDPDSIHQLRQSLAYASIIHDSDDVLPSWMNDIRREDAIRLCEEAKEKSKAYHDKIAELSREWEENVIELDVQGLISRFKTQYGGLFGRLKSQYKADVQTVHRYAKRKSLVYPDDQILKLLYKIRDIQDEKQWIEQNETQLKGAFGKYYQGIESNWKRIRAALDNAKILYVRIQQTDGITANAVSECLRAPEKVERINKLSNSQFDEQAIQKLSDLLLLLGYDQSSEFASFQNTLMPELNTITDTSSQFAQQIRKIASFRQDGASDLSSRMLVDLVSALETQEQYDRWFTDHQAEINEYVGVNDYEDEEIWEAQLRSIDEAITLLEEIPGYLQTASLKNNLCDHETLQAVKQIAGEILGHTANIELESEINKLKCFLPKGCSDVSIMELTGAIREVRHAASNIISTNMECNIYALHDLPVSEMVQSLDNVIKAREHKNKYHQLLTESPDLVKFFGEQADWNSVITTLEYILATHNCTETVFSHEFLVYFCNSDRARTEIEERLKKLNETYPIAEQQISEFAEIFPDKDLLIRQPLSQIAERYSKCMNHIEQLDMWLNYCDARDECLRYGLKDFVQQMERRDGAVKDPIGCFRYSFFQRWCQAIIGSKPAIARFKRFTQDNNLKEFCTLDVNQFATAQLRIRSKIIEQYPDPNMAFAAGDEMGILQRELNKKKNIMPLRKLFKAIPNLLLTLKPCLMMSPLSVSYFLEADSYHFDLVIFDEASQVFPQDSLGSIMRGEQVIIAGDTCQLPPTNFFSSNTANTDSDYDNDEEDEDDLPDEEISDSILEEADKAMARSTLLWHYRSKNEQLIAFSNQEIYHNRLITFPSSREKMENTGVEFIYVKDGVYVGKPKNCNLIEASRCVELIEDHIRNHADRSLGVIAFSEKQQQAILDAVQDFRENHPEYEEFFKEDKEDAFFVKNLENVQGDERDTIFFSVGYGYTQEQKDKHRPMSLRFGPLGRNGGERRLNVAITRAKINVKLIASILPNDINLDKTQSIGIKMLHDYLQFAIRGTDALHVSYEEHERDMMCGVLKDFLEEHGYRVIERLGCSGYKIDLAVIHPQNPNCYLATVECDGGSYTTAQTARERERLRRDVLTHMGWNVYRVWSAEWAKNKEVEGKKLIAFLREAEEKPLDYTVKSAPEISESHFEDLVEQVETTETQERNRYGFQTYVEADLYDTPPSRPGYPVTLNDHILHIVSVEQPISMDLLYQRIAPALGNTKATTRITTTVDAAIGHLNQKITKKDGFVTLKGFLNPVVRIPRADAEQRTINNIAPVELMEAMRTVAGKSYGLSKDGLIVETARALGYQRRGPRIQTVLEEIFDALVKNAIIHLADGKVHAVEESIHG